MPPASSSCPETDFGKLFAVIFTGIAGSASFFLDLPLSNFPQNSYLNPAKGVRIPHRPNRKQNPGEEFPLLPLCKTHDLVEVNFNRDALGENSPIGFTTSPVNPHKVLLIEDNPGDARLVEILLGESDLVDCCFVHKTSLGDGMAALESGEKFEAVLLDLTLPDSRGGPAKSDVSNVSDCSGRATVGKNERTRRRCATPGVIVALEFSAPYNSEIHGPLRGRVCAGSGLGRGLTSGVGVWGCSLRRRRRTPHSISHCSAAGE